MIFNKISDKLIENTLVGLINEAEEKLEDNKLDEVHSLLTDAHKLSLFRRYDYIERRLNDLFVRYIAKNNIYS